MKKITPIITVAFLMSTVSMAQTKTPLKLTKGQKYQVANTVQSSSSTDVMGQTMETNSNMASTYHIEVKEVSNNNYNLTNTISHMKMNMTMMGQNISFDSDKSEDMDGQIGTMFKGYINQPKDIVMDNQGKIMNAEPEDSSSAPDLIKKLNLAATGYGAQMAFLVLPTKPKVGDSWTDKTDMDGTQTSTNYIIKEINKDTAILAVSGTITTDASMEQQGQQMTIKSTGEFKGENKVNTKTGVVHSTNSVVETKGTVSAMGQDFPTSAKVTTTTIVTLL